MATANAINLSESGIVSYDGAGTFSSVGSPLNVSNGGTAASSVTAYAPLCGGTTGTGAYQSVSSAGTSGQYLVSGGAGSLPTWQTPGASVITFVWQGTTLNPSDNTSYGFIQGGTPVAISNDYPWQRFYVPKACTAKAVYGGFTIGSTGSSTTSSLYLYVNGSSTDTIDSNIDCSGSTYNVSNSSLNRSLSAGDYISIVWTTPVWPSNPSSVRAGFTIFCE